MEKSSIAGGERYPEAEAEAEYQQLVDDSDVFFRTLTHFHASYLATNNFISPSVGGTVLDLHQLFVEVTYRGGLDQVIKDRKWKEVVSALKLPTTNIGISFLLRKYYVALLYQFEQVYFFRKSAPTIQKTDDANRVPDIGLNAESTTMSHFPASTQIQPGVSFVGVIDEKFDNGYVVSVNVGSDQLRGILYHIPDRPQPSWGATLLDPSKPKPTRKTDNFYAEHYAALTPISREHEEHISMTIGHLWNKLPVTE